MKTAIVTYGRFNPVTKGHMKLFSKMQSIKKKIDGDLYVFSSRREKDSTNPLSFYDKKSLLKRVLPGFIIFDNVNVTTPFHAMKYLSDKGYKNIIFVVGEDRVSIGQNIRPYINHEDPEKAFLFENFEIQVAGKRNVKSKGIPGISGSRIRFSVMKNDYAAFKRDFVGIPDKFVEIYFKKIRAKVPKVSQK